MVSCGGSGLHHVGYPAERSRLVEGLTRDEVCRRFQPKVLLLARRVHERLSSDVGIGLDDLAAVGSIGLLEAFDRFDPSRGIQFTTFAEYRIRGAMYDALRDNDSFSRRRRQLAKRIAAAADAIQRETGVKPTGEELARLLGISLDDLHSAVDSTKPVVYLSLDGQDSEDGEVRPVGDRLPDPGRPVDAGLISHEAKLALKNAIAELPERQRQCVTMYYGGELTLAEIAAVFDLTVSRVSQILSEAREKLRKKLASAIEAGDLGVP